jgi:hypothetical protein
VSHTFVTVLLSAQGHFHGHCHQCKDSVHENQHLVRCRRQALRVNDKAGVTNDTDSCRGVATKDRCGAGATLRCASDVSAAHGGQARGSALAAW